MGYGRQISTEFKNVYGDMLRQAGVTALAERRHELARGSATDYSAGVVTKSAATGNIVPQYRFQTILRPLYGKPGFHPPCIGDHPDFIYLKDTGGTENYPITTMFMDIESSTRLGLLYPLEAVHQIKNTFIMAAIELVKSFDGHVHRIMGDAVMAYFGGKDVTPEQGIIDGLNCAATLMFFAKNSVIPKLNEDMPDAEFGIRIGLDYGEQEQVLWARYGYPGMSEVTATSFHVDVAAKLQHAAGRNQIMLGESLRAKLDLHDELLEVKTCERDGEIHREPFVTPNHIGTDGYPIDYKQHLFRGDFYLAMSPMAPEAAETWPCIGARLSPIAVTATVHRQRVELNGAGTVISTGTIVPKDHEICFRIQPPPDVRYPCTVKYIVENHGQQAEEQPNNGNHESREHQILSASDLGRFRHWESTKYRGLHYLIVELRSGGVITHRCRFGVYVE